MKFNYGYWMMRKGVTPHFASQAYDVWREGETLTVYAPTKPIVNRGDTLNLPMLTVSFSTPMENVIAVTATHFAGAADAMPRFDQRVEPVAPDIDADGSPATFRSGDLEVRVNREGWGYEFVGGGRPLTDSGWRNLSYMQAEGLGEEDGVYMVEQLGISPGEYLYGLGERFTAFGKNGQRVDLWQEDGGTASEIAYKNIPFYLSNRGYGVFIDHTEPVSLEIGSEKVSRVSMAVRGEQLRYAIIYGPTPIQVLERYTALTGRPALPPAWSFGLWLSTSFTTNYDEETVTSFIQGMEDRHIPLSVFHFDCFWMREFNWVDFTFDSRTFPNPREMLARYKARGLKLCAWINPYVAQRSPLFEEGRKKGYLIRKTDGSVWQTDLWQAGMGVVDFTNPEAAAWYTGKLKELLDLGIDCFKTDFGERIPWEDVVYFDGSDPAGMHNYYTQLYNKAVFDLLVRERGEGEACLFARSATAGGQQFPVHWGGDCSATYPSMAETLRGGLSAAQSGIAFWSHDISGFEQTAPPDVYKRWCAFGLLSSHSRLHGSTSYRVPWYFGEEASDVLRHFVTLKHRLMPYLYRMAAVAHERGTPVMRPLMMQFPEDRGSDCIDLQYMLGDSLLVAPIFRPDGEVDFYLPPGVWTHLLSGEALPGGWHHAAYDYFSLPLFVRQNTLLPLGGNDQRPDYDYTEGLELQLFALQDGATAACAIPDLAGRTVATATAARQGATLTLTAAGLPAVTYLLRGVSSVASVQGGLAEATPQGLRIRAKGPVVVEL